MLTPLAQSTLTHFFIKLLENEKFLDVYYKAFDAKRFNSESERTEYLRYFWFGNSFRTLLNLFFSRESIHAMDFQDGVAQEENPPEFRDEELDEFLSLSREERCKYRLAFPFLENEGTMWRHLSFLRPTVIRKVLNSARSRLTTEVGDTNIVHETYELTLPTSVRRTYLSRLSSLVRPFSTGNRRYLLTSQVFHKDLLDLNLNESEGSSDEGDEVDRLLSKLSSFNYTLLQRFPSVVGSSVNQLAEAALSVLDKRLDSGASPLLFIHFVHALAYTVFMASLGHGGHFFASMIRESRNPRSNKYRLLLALVLEKELMKIEVLLAGASVGLVVREILSNTAKNPEGIYIPSVTPSLPSGNSLSSFSRQVTRLYFDFIIKTFARLGFDATKVGRLAIPVFVPIDRVFHSGSMALESKSFPVKRIQASLVAASIESLHEDSLQVDNIKRVASQLPSFATMDAEVSREFRTGLSLAKPSGGPTGQPRRG
ncbi:hypothetical protein SAMN04488243_12221 [Thermus arciformis]|uniref:Uncharacterized protein n=1 Tax=Thermus arciformis TaxID=482827 RepID=A0A1G7HYD1_9DEIN|nr:hypothetical protein [Thermus arciformis]SDF05144.1 hypothetical protein SAMN04488243_12221 [Thermus arciformis]